MLQGAPKYPNTQGKLFACSAKFGVLIFKLLKTREEINSSEQFLTISSALNSMSDLFFKQTQQAGS